MQLSTILLGSFLTIIFLCNSCASDDDIDNIKNPVHDCLSAILSGNQKKCFTLFTSYKKYEAWSEEQPWRICETQCMVKRRGRFELSLLEWVWDAHVRCNSLAPEIVGKATKKSRNGAVHWALKDFKKKTAAKGRFNAEELQCWEANY
jgi:hypothetical protein